MNKTNIIKEWLIFRDIRKIQPSKNNTHYMLRYPYNKAHLEFLSKILLEPTYGEHSMYNEDELFLRKTYEKEIDFLNRKILKNLDFIDMQIILEVSKLDDYRSRFMVNGRMEDVTKKVPNTLSLGVYASIMAGYMYRRRREENFSFMLTVFAEIFQVLHHITSCNDYSKQNLPFD